MAIVDLSTFNIARIRPVFWENSEKNRFDGLVGSKTHDTMVFSSGLPARFLMGMPAVDGFGRARIVQLALKRVIDLALASLALLIIAPLLILVALAVRLTSRGPVLFRQDRDGLNGKIICVYKFRTMFVDRDDVQAVQGDARVTPLGRVLRRTSIDELPQLLNVIRGDMSLIGPRPHPLGLLAAGEPYEKLVPYYHARHVMRPGISGWAQANGLRGSTNEAETARARIEHDIAYIQNFSLLLDFRIMIRTVLREFVTGSGY